MLLVRLPSALKRFQRHQSWVTADKGLSLFRHLLWNAPRPTHLLAQPVALVYCPQGQQIWPWNELPGSSRTTLKTKTPSACGLGFTKGLPFSPWSIPTMAEFSMWSPIQVLYSSKAALLPGTNKMRWVHPWMEKWQNWAVVSQWKSPPQCKAGLDHPFPLSGLGLALQAQHQGVRLDGSKLSTRH